MSLAHELASLHGDDGQLHHLTHKPVPAKFLGDAFFKWAGQHRNLLRKVGHTQNITSSCAKADIRKVIK